MGDKVSLGQFFRLYGLYAKMDLNWLLRDTKIALLIILADLVTSISAVLGVFLLAWRFDGVGNMSRWEVLFMLGFFSTVNGLFQLFFSGSNTGHISRIIGRGQLDHMLIQPLPLPVQIVTSGFIPFTGGSTFMAGIAITVWAGFQLGMAPGAVWLLGFAGYLLLGVAVIVGLSYIFASLAFYAPVACEEISSDVIELTGSLGGYPLSGMSAGMQAALVSVVPTGLLGWFPAMALLGKAPLGLPAVYPLLIATLIWAIALYGFRKGMKYYVKTGSQRYNAGGHRG